MKRLLVIFLVGAILTGCENARFGAREKGALTGGALGAGLGAIVGNQVGNTGAGIAIGSAMGALSGGVVGSSIDETDRQIEERDQRLDRNERELLENRRIIEHLRRQGADVRETDRGVVVNLPDVLFAFNSARLQPEALRTVREISRVATQARGRSISIEGHTDSVGTMSYNQRLSRDRAQAVANQLVDTGISPKRLRIRGYGESQPIASNSTEGGRSKNRRVEVVLENR